jgi:hypothetical protein
MIAVSSCPDVSMWVLIPNSQLNYVTAGVGKQINTRLLAISAQLRLYEFLLGRGQRLVKVWSRSISVSIVSGYGLDDRAIVVRSPIETRDFSCSLCIQTGSGAHPASCTVDIGRPFPGAKARPGRDADHSPPSSAEVDIEQELYLLSRPSLHWCVADCFTFAWLKFNWRLL